MFVGQTTELRNKVKISFINLTDFKKITPLLYSNLAVRLHAFIVSGWQQSFIYNSFEEPSPWESLDSVLSGPAHFFCADHSLSNSSALKPHQQDGIPYSEHNFELNWFTARLNGSNWWLLVPIYIFWFKFSLWSLSQSYHKVVKLTKGLPFKREMILGAPVGELSQLSTWLWLRS